MIYTLEQGVIKQKATLVGSLLAAGLLAFVAVGIFYGQTNAAPAQKVDVCHATGSGSYQKISISENAVQKHVDNHGDFLAVNGTSFVIGDELVVTDDCTAWRLVETVKVPVTSAAGTYSEYETSAEKNYRLEVSGTYRYQRGTTYGIADAEWAYRNDAYADPVYSHEWTKGEGKYNTEFGLDVLVDGNNVEWGDFSSTNEYGIEYNGTGNTIHFGIYDSAYGDNSDIGNGLNVKIYEQL